MPYHLLPISQGIEKRERKTETPNPANNRPVIPHRRMQGQVRPHEDRDPGWTCHSQISSTFSPLHPPACLSSTCQSNESASTLSLLVFRVLGADDVNVAFPSHALQSQVKKKVSKRLPFLDQKISKEKGRQSWSMQGGWMVTSAVEPTTVKQSLSPGIIIDRGDIATNLAAVTQLLDTAPDLHPSPLAARHGPHRSPGQNANRSADAPP